MYKPIKRLLDIVLSSAGLIVLTPLLLVVAVLIKLDSQGPVFYKQIRVGRKREKFYFIKFRSMVTDADKKGSLVTSKDDNRITKIGYFIRRTKIDELPQLLNVVKGDLSLIGPRPEVPRYVDKYKAEWERIFDIQPGITDLSTLQFRDEEEVLDGIENREEVYTRIIVPIKLNLALEYRDKISLWLDFKILFLTVWAITLGRKFSKPDDHIAKEARQKALALDEELKAGKS